MKRPARGLSISFVALFLFAASASAQTSVSPTKTYKASGASDQDDMVVWIHPTDFSKSTVIGSDKASGKIFVYDIGGATIQTISSGGKPGNIDLRYNFPLGGKTTDIVVYNERNSNTLHVYSVDASTRQLTRVDNGSLSTSSNYGVCLYKSPSSGKFYAFKTAKNGNIEQYELLEDGSGRVKGVKVRSFNVGSQTEGCVADDENKVVYMAEEGKKGPGAIWKYGAEPGDGSSRSLVDDSKGNLKADVEGITIYYTSGGGGYIIASSQGASKFDVYERQPPHSYKFTFKVSGTGSTDGIDVSNVNFGSAFPQGVFFAHSGGASFKGVPWQSIASAGGLTIDTFWNPRGDGSPPPPPTATPTKGSTPTPTPTRKPTPTGVYIPGDIDGDGDVDIFDYNLLITNFGATGGNVADIDGDGDVDIFDYNILVTNFGKTTGTPTPTSTPPTKTPTPTKQPSLTPPPPGEGLWISPQRLASLPMSGSAWNSLKSIADGSLGTPDLADQDTRHNLRTMGVALVYARTGNSSYRAKAADAIMSAIGTEGGARALAIGRNLAAYVIAADLIDFKNYRPSDESTFRSWLSTMRTRDFSGRTLISCHRDRPNNWGTMCGASRIAADIYLNDKSELDKAALVYRGYAGDRSAFAGFKFQSGAFTFMCDTSKPRPINPVGCIKGGHDLSGAPVDDIQRAGNYKWPPSHTNYAWGGLSGAIAQAEMLHRAGYDAYNWESQAMLRGARFLHEVVNFSQSGATTWVDWIINYRYNKNYSTSSTTMSSRLISFTDWTHAR